ncbi:NitT/TauT family transport system permease protein [Nakamurella panacisegetis]|uniref:NitT/TauT family transport system permease protein n=1 Tax=Nakamurella panacisegetis TaxID=1090615 RepID=A0A1H0N025_9ACTN|nr:ABC transporter permease subunit [Nakamurella panacisegetis]SDO86058.1 NitT/TauT family transport system permease protein [Nakamurella panacisegetis]
MSAPPAESAATLDPVRSGVSLLRRTGSVFGFVWPPIVLGLVVLALWQWVTKAFDVQTFVLPAPSDIGSALGGNLHRIYLAAGKTGANALAGLLLGTFLAVIAAALSARLRIADELITPLAAAAATMPIVVLAPIFNTMFDSTSTWPRRLVVTVATFVPVFVNSVRGLKQLSPVHAELMSSYAAGGLAVLRYVRIPGALPHFFTGLRLAASLSVISAVVAEYFGGLQTGLGPKITSAVAASDYALAWAYVVGAIVLGLLFFLAALLVETLAMRARQGPVS